MATKKFYRGALIILTWMAMVITCMLSLASCTSSTATEENDPTTITVEKNYKVIDMLKASQYVGNGSQSIYYYLLENGEIVVKGYIRNYPLPFTSAEAKEIMAFRRGEEVTIKVLETVPAK